MGSSENFEAGSSESFFRNLLETAPDAMVIVDRRGRISIVNSQTERMFGYLREELYGEPIEMLLPEKLRYSHRKSRSGYSVDPHVRPMGRGMVLTGLRKDGSEFPVEISLSPVVTDGGSFVSSVIRDVTERKEMEREIIDARRSAERANRANTAFLAAASHDLRQPVQALSLLNGALRRTVDSSLALEMIDSQQQSLDAMTNLLNSLLDISRLDAGAVAPEIEVFPIQRLLDRLSAEFARQARQKGLDFHIESSDILVESDPNLLGEIIQNFVSNAIRYTSKGSVRMQCEQTGDNVCIRISDTGIGIEAKHIKDIFAEFHQLKAQGQKNEGFGLGLAIVQRLSNLLGHKIEVSSVPGSGSEFSICLPAIGAHKLEQAVELSSRDVASEGGKFGTIILIEDDSSVANALAALLEAEGYRVAIAASAQEAKTIARHIDATPNLIVTDFHLLDGSTGIEAVVDLRELFESDIPALIVTGDTSIVVQEARNLPNSILIRKPVNPDQLLRDADIAVETGKVPPT
jgi:two-component system, sensor histidine kinase